VIDALARKGKVRVVVDGLTAANDLGLTDAVRRVPACSPMAACGPLPSATSPSTSKPPRPAASTGRAVLPCASCRRSIGCATCSLPTTEASASASSPSSETPIMDRPFRTTCAAACRRCRSGCGSSCATYSSRRTLMRRRRQRKRSPPDAHRHRPISSRRRGVPALKVAPGGRSAMFCPPDGLEKRTGCPRFPMPGSV